jgi:hypothetical protein
MNRMSGGEVLPQRRRYGSVRTEQDAWRAIPSVFGDRFGDVSPEPADLKTPRYPKPRQDRQTSQKRQSLVSARHEAGVLWTRETAEGRKPGSEGGAIG